MRPNQWIGIRTTKAWRKRPRTALAPRAYGGNPANSTFFVKVQGFYVDIVARPVFKGEIVPCARCPLDIWLALSDEQRKEMCMGIRKPSAGHPSQGGPIRPMDPACEGEMPTLFAYLADDQWEDGSARLRSTIILFCEDDLFKMALTDKDSDLTLWVASKTFAGLFGGMEARLNDPEAEWRKRKGPGNPPRKKG